MTEPSLPLPQRIPPSPGRLEILTQVDPSGVLSVMYTKRWAVPRVKRLVVKSTKWIPLADVTDLSSAERETAFRCCLDDGVTSAKAYAIAVMTEPSLPLPHPVPPSPGRLEILTQVDPSGVLSVMYTKSRAVSGVRSPVKNPTGWIPLADVTDLSSAQRETAFRLCLDDGMTWAMAYATVVRV